MKKYFSLLFSVFAFICNFLMFWYCGDLLNKYFVFVLIFIAITILILILSIIIECVCIYSSIKMREKNIINYISLAVSLLTVVIIVIFPFQDAKFNLEFKLYMDERQEVVEMVKNETIVADDLGNAELPSEFEHITSDGNISVYQNDKEQVIAFWIFRGMLSGSEQLIYSSQDEGLIYENETAHSIISVKKIKEHWYLVVTDY